MAVFRIEKNRDYTVMSNHHLRNKALSLKAKGLLSLMLSLPDDWDYTLAGLAYVCKDGIDSISSAVKELEKAGYIHRRRVRNAKGQLTEIEYTILESPILEKPEQEKPVLDYPEQGNPILEKPVLGIPTQASPEQACPTQGNPVQLNTNQSNTKKQNTDLPNTQPPSVPVQPDVQTLRNEIREQIDYDSFRKRSDPELVDELVEIMLEVAMCCTPTIRFSRNMEYPTELVKHRFQQITSEHIEKVLDGINECTSRIHNTRAYLITSLFNAPATISSYYTMRVNHDLYGQE